MRCEIKSDRTQIGRVVRNPLVCLALSFCLDACNELATVDIWYFKLFMSFITVARYMVYVGGSILPKV
jgi:hypothetical protein